MGVRELPGVDITVESGLGFRPKPARRFAFMVQSDGFSDLTILKSLKDLEAWKTALSMPQSSYEPWISYELLRDAFLNGASEILIMPFETDPMNSVSANLPPVLEWRDEQGRGVEYIVWAAIEDAGPDYSDPSDPDFSPYINFVTQIGQLVDQAWNNDEYPVFVLVPVWPKPASRTVSQWISDIETAVNQIRSSWSYEGRVSIWVPFARMLKSDGTEEMRSAIGAIAGMLARAKPHESVGWVEKFGIKGALAIEPELDPDLLTQLDEAHVNGLRLWPGYGIVPHFDWMIAKATDDYHNIRYRRIMDTAVRGVMDAFTPFVNSPGVDSAALEALKQALKKPLDEMLVSKANPDGSITDYRLDLWPDEDVLVNGIIHAELQIVPVGSKRTLKGVFRLVKKVE